ncbi:isoprenylcysteine carboxylmethyltransferase family protein [Arthrobacter sp. StoSoilA2]|uniref:methyltransferase family protein n=1 Tax=Arthrobacter sp. StoSoilA2 TaxID=2830990 RepID=UPI001CC65503|nr:isoprenylcysteine carboxylmethyltransferase family protein [Arthrobacter sp. StoSoilA2]
MTQPPHGKRAGLQLLCRSYFAVQAAAGLSWWIAIFLSPVVREATLGSLDPVVVAAFDIPLFVIASALAAIGLKAAAAVATAWTGIVAIALGVYATVTTEAGSGVLIMIAAAACSLAALSILFLGGIPTAWIIQGPFAFRSATGRRTTTNVGATIGQMILFWGFFLAVIPLALTFLEERWEVSLPFPQMAAPVGALLLTFASALGVASALTMSWLGAGTPLPSAMPNRLVIAGPYRWIRNPMAVAGITQGAAVGLILGSWLVVAYAVLGSLLWNYAVRPLEEADLEERFGAEFIRYRESVRCWIPRV